MRAENPVHGSDQPSCASRRLAVLIADHVPRSFSSLITRVTAWLRLSRREETRQTQETLILRYQLAVLQRRQSRPLGRELGGTGPARDPAWRATESAAPGLRVLVTPDTILRWHRNRTGPVHVSRRTPGRGTQVSAAGASHPGSGRVGAALAQPQLNHAEPHRGHAAFLSGRGANAPTWPDAGSSRSSRQPQRYLRPHPEPTGKTALYLA